MPKSRGFTLIELLIAISIIAILSAIGFTMYSVAMKQGRDSRRQSDLRSIQSALEQYYSDQGFYPFAGGVNGLNTLLSQTTQPSFTSNTGQPSPSPSPKIYMNSLPQDPTSILYKYNASTSGGLTCDNSSLSKCVKYCLSAVLENSGSGIPPAGWPCIAGGTYRLFVTPP